MSSYQRTILWNNRAMTHHLDSSGWAGCLASDIRYTCSPIFPSSCDCEVLVRGNPWLFRPLPPPHFFFLFAPLCAAIPQTHERSRKQTSPIRPRRGWAETAWIWVTRLWQVEVYKGPQSFHVTWFKSEFGMWPDFYSVYFCSIHLSRSRPWVCVSFTCIADLLNSSWLRLYWLAYLNFM